MIVTIYAKITHIHEGAFARCTSLISINIPNTVQVLEKFFYYGNYEDDGNVTAVTITFIFEPGENSISMHGTNFQ